MSPAALSALARYGPFFAVDTADAADAADGDGWRPLAELSEPAVLQSRVSAVAQGLAALAPAPVEVPVRIAASIGQLGLVARIAAVALAAETDGLPLPGPPGWWWQDTLGAYPVAITPGTVTGSWPERLLALVGPTTAAMITIGGLSPRIGWGNVASGLAGAATMITSVDPAAGERAVRLVGDAQRGPLAGTGAYDRGRFRRRSCCLIYRLAEPPSYCGDCVLTGLSGPASACRP